MEQDPSLSHTINPQTNQANQVNPDDYSKYFKGRHEIASGDLSEAQQLALKRDVNVGGGSRMGEKGTERRIRKDPVVQQAYQRELIGQHSQYAPQVVSGGANGNVFDTARTRYAPMNQAHNINF